MNTVDTLIQKFIDHIASVDLNKASVCDLNGYANVLGVLHNMKQPDYVEKLATMMAMNKPCDDEKKEA